jgi:hypothetical protein
MSAEALAKALGGPKCGAGRSEFLDHEKSARPIDCASSPRVCIKGLSPVVWAQRWESGHQTIFDLGGPPIITTTGDRKSDGVAPLARDAL